MSKKIMSSISLTSINGKHETVQGKNKIKVWPLLDSMNVN